MRARLCTHTHIYILLVGKCFVQNRLHLNLIKLDKHNKLYSNLLRTYHIEDINPYIFV